MALLIDLLIFLITAGVVLFLLLIKRTAWFNALFFGIFILFVLLFVFKKELNIRWSERIPAPVYLLVDRSLSSTGRYYPHFQANSPRYKVFYFADSLSERTNGLNPEFTSLYDSIRALKNTAGAQAKIIVFSDFLDNNSLNGFEKTGGVYPVLPERSSLTSNYFSLTDIRIPDFYETGEPVPLTASFYSSRSRRKELLVLDGNRVLNARSIPAGKGYQTVQWDMTLPQTGNRILTFVLKDPDSGQTAVPQVKKSVEGISGMQRILFIAGRPSEEFVFLKRFIEKIRWLRTDFVLPATGKKKINPNIISRQKYNALIFMDVSKDQFASGDPAEQMRSTGLPVFYQTGTRNFDEIETLVRSFTNITSLRNYSEIKFRYNNNDLIVLSALATENQLLEISPKERIFFGWNSWKWDFIRSKEDIAYNDYESFWQNQINFLLNSSVNRSLPVRLNYYFGENDIPGTNDQKSGLLRYQTNGQNYLMTVGHHPAESAPLPPDTDTALRYQTNLVFADEIASFPEWIEKVRGKEKVTVERKWSVSFANDLPAFIIMALSIILFWIFRDREEMTH